MRKSLSKRIRITRNGKVMRRPTGVNHFRTRKSGDNIQGKRKGVELNYAGKGISN